MSARGARRPRWREAGGWRKRRTNSFPKKSDYQITLFSFLTREGEGFDSAVFSSNLEKKYREIYLAKGEDFCRYQYRKIYLSRVGAQNEFCGTTTTIMKKQRVLLICSQHLFGESMETILRAAADVELVGPWELGEEVCQRIAEARPNVVVIADEESQEEVVAHLTSAIIEQYPELSVIRAGLNENVFRVFSTHTLLARGADLLETIRNLPS